MDLRASGLALTEISLRTGIHVDRATLMCQRGLEKLGVRSAKAAMDLLSVDDRFLPMTLLNRRNTG